MAGAGVKWTESGEGGEREMNVFEYVFKIGLLGCRRPPFFVWY